LEQVRHWLVSQQLAPHFWVPAGHEEQMPLTQKPLAHSLGVVHSAPGVSVPGVWQDRRLSRSVLLGSRQISPSQQSESVVHR
jgi:hypothetical protein